MLQVLLQSILGTYLNEKRNKRLGRYDSLCPKCHEKNCMELKDVDISIPNKRYTISKCKNCGYEDIKMEEVDSSKISTSIGNFMAKGVANASTVYNDIMKD